MVKSNYVLAQKITDRFTETGQQSVQKLLKNKKEAGFDSFNLFP